MKEAFEIPIAEAGPFTLEKRGIDYIPKSERWATPSSLFWMWGGAIFNVEILVYGAVLMSFGLSFFQSVVIILLGNLSYILLGVASLQGPEAGTTTFIINRASFGSKGSRLIALFNWLTQVGFETEGIAIVVIAGMALLSKVGVGSSTTVKVILLVVAGGIQLILPAFGHQAILKTLKVLFVPFFVLFLVFGILSIGKVNLHSVAHGANWQTLTEGLAFILSASGLGWTENGNDYSRYLPRDASKGKTVLFVTLGTYVPSVLLMILGAAAATFAGSASGSIPGIASKLTPWFIWPYLIVAIIQIFAINSLDLYSSGVTLQALGLKLARWKATLLDTVICTSLAAYAVFSSSFNTLLSEFILYIIVWVAPWTAIYLVDWLMRKRQYSATDLQLVDRGIYYRGNGIFMPGVVAQIAGMVGAMLTIDVYPHYVSVFSNATNGADISVFVGLLVGGVVYYVLAKRKIDDEVTAQFAAISID